MYRSTDASGQPNAVTGTVLVPKSADPATAPLIAFAVGTHGPAFRCAPSEMVRIGALYEQPAVNDLLRSGYAVAITDYEGYRPDPRTTYVTGRSEGHAVIDVVRAAQRLPDARLSRDAKVVFRGCSQGGGAAMWAGQLQPEYAPELNLVDLTAPAVSVPVVLPTGANSIFDSTGTNPNRLNLPEVGGSARSPVKLPVARSRSAFRLLGPSGTAPPGFLMVDVPLSA